MNDLPCKFDHNGECLICDCWPSDCPIVKERNIMKKLSVLIKTKAGYTDKQVWDFLLSKDVNITPLGGGFTSAEIPPSIRPKLEEMASVEEKRPKKPT